MTSEVDYDWNCTKVGNHNYYHPRRIGSSDFDNNKFLTNFTDPRNPLIRVSNDGIIFYAKTKEQKIELISDTRYGAGIYFVWVGKYSSDTFYLPGSLRQEALRALGHKIQEEKLAELNEQVSILEREYQATYRFTQRTQAKLLNLEESLTNAREERDMLNAYLNQPPQEEEYNYPADRYIDTDDNDYWSKS